MSVDRSCFRGTGILPVWFGLGVEGTGGMLLLRGCGLRTCRIGD
jgi:hypothetical protein